MNLNDKMKHPILWVYIDTYRDSKRSIWNKFLMFVWIIPLMALLLKLPESLGNAIVRAKGK